METDNEDNDRATPDVLVPASSLDDLLEFVKCPVCKEHMVLPITLCVKGHSICHNCRQTKDKCTICCEPFCKTRNVNLENISLWSAYPCPNDECPTTQPLEFLTQHLHRCPYTSIVCPLNKFQGKTCPWEGFLKNLVSHVQKSHTKLYAEGNIFKSSSLQDAVKFIFYDGELFLLRKQFVENRLHCILQKLDSSLGHFTVNFVLASSDGLERIVFSNTVRNTQEDVDALFRTGNDCLRLSSKIYSRFVLHGKLGLQIFISKLK